MDRGPPGSSVHGILQARVGGHALLQGIFSSQGSNLYLLNLTHWQVDSYHPRHWDRATSRHRRLPEAGRGGENLKAAKQNSDGSFKTGVEDISREGEEGTMGK